MCFDAIRYHCLTVTWPRLFHKPEVCPWWLVWTFDNPLRSVVHPPERVLGPYVGPGFVAADVGCGRGHFTLGLARLVGPQGRVYALDVQPRMLKMTYRRARRAGLSDRVTPLICPSSGPSFPEKIDFVLVFWMLHEVQDQAAFLGCLASSVSPRGLLLLAEPVLHVGERKFDDELATAQAGGWILLARPAIRLSRAALLRKE